MPWLKIDDRFDTHPKTLAVWTRSRAAVALDVFAMTYASRHSTDGHVPAAAVMLWLPDEAERTEAIAVLVDVGRWRETADGYEVVDFLDYNPTAAQTAERRARRAAAGRKGGKASGESRRRSTGEPNG